MKALEEHGIGRPSTYADDHLDAAGSRVRGDGRAALHSHRHRQDRQPLPDRVTSTSTSSTDSRRRWKTSSTRCRAAKRNGRRRWSKFWKPFIDQVEKIEKNVTREQVAQARELGKDPATGKPVTVRMGRFGPFVQIGTKDDEEKPRFAGLRPGQKMDSITLAEAMELFKLPRTLGATADGETIITNVGRFGPYVKYGSKYVSLKEDDPYKVTLERALEVIRAEDRKPMRTASSLDFGADGIQVLNGRYGPYVTDGRRTRRSRRIAIRRR